jgi:hypothetical protein
MKYSQHCVEFFMYFLLFFLNDDKVISNFFGVFVVNVGQVYLREKNVSKKAKIYEKFVHLEIFGHSEHCYFSDSTLVQIIQLSFPPNLKQLRKILVFIITLSQFLRTPEY